MGITWTPIIVERGAAMAGCNIHDTTPCEPGVHVGELLPYAQCGAWCDGIFLHETLSIDSRYVPHGQHSLPEILLTLGCITFEKLALTTPSLV